MTPAEEILAHALARPPTLGAARLICIDGLTGAGKSTLASEVAALSPDLHLVHTDDVLAGWDGLPGLGRSIGAFLHPLAVGRPSRWSRWSWYADRWAESRPLSAGGLLLLEGVGSAAAAYDELITTLVWVEADLDARLARSLARDGADQHTWWEKWLVDESELHERDRTRRRADLVYAT